MKEFAAPVESDFIAIKNNLSEIAEAVQADSQKNLGLGKLATEDALTAEDTGVYMPYNSTAEYCRYAFAVPLRFFGVGKTPIL